MEPVSNFEYKHFRSFSSCLHSIQWNIHFSCKLIDCGPLPIRIIHFLCYILIHYNHNQIATMPPSVLNEAIPLILSNSSLQTKRPSATMASTSWAWFRSTRSPLPMETAIWVYNFRTPVIQAHPTSYHDLNHENSQATWKKDGKLLEEWKRKAGRVTLARHWLLELYSSLHHLTLTSFFGPTSPPIRLTQLASFTRSGTDRFLGITT